jgi:hypothetical protein
MGKNIQPFQYPQTPEYDKHYTEQKPSVASAFQFHDVYFLLFKCNIYYKYDERPAGEFLPTAGEQPSAPLDPSDDHHSANQYQRQRKND